MNPTDWTQRLAARLRTAQPMLRLALLRDPGAGHVVVGRVEIAPEFRGEGRADQVMTQIVNTAVRHHETVALSPSDELGADVAQLVGWYQRMGFTPNTRQNYDRDIGQTMYRRPDRGRLPVRRRPAHPHLVCAGGGLTLEFPVEVSRQTLDRHGRELMAAVTAMGLRPRTDWQRGVVRGVARLLLDNEDDPAAHGAILVGARSGRVVAGHLVVPGHTDGRVEFGTGPHWSTALAAHRPAPCAAPHDTHTAFPAPRTPFTRSTR